MGRRPLIALLLVAVVGAAIGIFFWPDSAAPSGATPSDTSTGDPVSIPHSDRQDSEAVQRASVGPNGAHDSSAFPDPLDLQGASFSLRVVDENGAPIAGARVLCGDPDYGFYGSLDDREWDDSSIPIHADVSTDGDGIARVAGLPLHRSLMIAAEDAGRTRVQHQVLAPGEGEQIDVGTWWLEPAPTVRLRFVTPDGAPAAGVQLSLRLSAEDEDSRDRNFSCRSDDRGLAELEHVPEVLATHHAPALAAHAWVYGRGYYRSQPVTLDLRDRERECVVTVHRGRSVSGVVRQSDGAPVAGAVIGTWPAWGDDDKPGDQAHPWAASHIDWTAFREGVAASPDGNFLCHGLDDDEEVFALTAFVPPNQIYASRWTRQAEGVDFRIPVRHVMRGKVSGPFALDRVTVTAARPRETLGGLDAEREYAFTLWPSDIPCDADGCFALELPEETWQLRIAYPGGSLNLGEPTALTRDVDLGTLELGAGASILVHCADAAHLADPTLRLERYELVEDMWLDEAEESWNRMRVNPDREAPSEWRFRGLEPGRYRVVMDATGCEPTAVVVELDASASEELELDLVPTGSVIVSILGHDGQPSRSRAVTLRASVSDPPTEREAMLEALSQWQHPDYELEFALDSLGRAGDLPAGEYTVMLSLAENESSNWSSTPMVEVGSLQVEAGRTTHFEYALASMGQVSFVVRASGEPVAGARVSFFYLGDGRSLGWNDLEDPDLGGETGEDGSFFAEALAPGHYLAASRLAEADPWTLQDFTVAAGAQSVEVDLAVGQLTGRVAGRVVDEFLNPTVRVSLYSERIGRLTQDQADHDAPLLLEFLNWGATSASVQAATDGSYRFVHVPPDRYRIRASSEDGDVGWSEWFILESDGVQDVNEIRIQQQAEVEWTLFGLTAWDDYDACLRLRPADGGEIWESIWFWSDEDEDVFTLELPLGRWFVDLEDADGTLLGRLTVIEISATTPPAPLTLPTPQSVGAKQRAD